MKNNGFTLVELLATITIMILLISIAIPTINSSISKKQQTQFETYAKEFINSAIMCYKHGKGNCIDFESYSITLSDLNNYGYIDEMPTNPYTKEVFDSTCEITKIGDNKYKFECGDESYECETK